MGSEREREREREKCEHQVCTPTPHSTPSLGIPSLASAVLHRDPSPPAPSPSARAHSEHPGCLTIPQGKDQAGAAKACLHPPGWGRQGQPGSQGMGGTRWQHGGPYGFMLKKSLMPSGLTGLLLLFFSATDFSLVQVRCTFSGAASTSSPGD